MHVNALSQLAPMLLFFSGYAAALLLSAARMWRCGGVKRKYWAQNPYLVPDVFMDGLLC